MKIKTSSQLAVIDYFLVLSNRDIGVTVIAVTELLITHASVLQMIATVF